MLVKTYGSALNGIEAFTVTIEVNIDRGVQFFLVGLPDSAVKESQQRIESALNNNNLKYPKRKITINMAPADIRKEADMMSLFHWASSQLPAKPKCPIWANILLWENWDWTALSEMSLEAFHLWNWQRKSD